MKRRNKTVTVKTLTQVMKYTLMKKHREVTTNQCSNIKHDTSVCSFYWPDMFLTRWFVNKSSILENYWGFSACYWNTIIVTIKINKFQLKSGVRNITTEGIKFVLPCGFASSSLHIYTKTSTSPFHRKCHIARHWPFVSTEPLSVSYKELEESPDNITFSKIQI